MKRTSFLFTLGLCGALLWSSTVAYESVNEEQTDRIETSEKKRTSEPYNALLIDKKWALIEVEGEKVEHTQTEDDLVIFVLSADGSNVTGWDGCNTVTGDFVFVENDMIHFSNLSSTDHPCQTMEVNGRKLIDVLYFANTFKVEDDKLVFKSCAEEVFAVFKGM